MRWFWVLAVVVVCSAAVLAGEGRDYVAGRSYFGDKGYIEYVAGNLPIIVSVPHGGGLAPSEIGDRTWGTVVTDTNTEQLARAFVQEVQGMTGRYPHVVICHLKRTKLDVNREIGEAAQGDAYAEIAWREWHGFIETARDLVIRQCGAGVYLDLHGHGHEIQRLELGYLLSDSVLQMSDADIDGYKDVSSLRTLAETTKSGFAELVRGPDSLGGLMEERGFPSIPSPEYPDAGGDPYYSAGYNTQQHTSRHGGVISGFQLECNYKGVRDTEANRIRTARALAESLFAWLKVHYRIDVDNLSAGAFQNVSANWLASTLQERVTGRLVGQWLFDDGTGADSSGNGNHGTFVKGDGTTSIGIVYDAERGSNVLELNNPPGHSVNSFLECGSDTGGNGALDMEGAITIAAWMKVDNWHVGHQYLLTKGRSYQLTRNRRTDGIRTYMGSMDSTTLVSSKDVDDGRWHHVAVVYDSSSAVRTLYVDGEAVSRDRQSVLLKLSVEPLVIGGRGNPAYDHRGWDGRLDDVRLYDYALRGDEVLLVYAGLEVGAAGADLECHEIAVGDLNQDCRVDYLDFAAVASDWLEEAGLQAPDSP